VAIFNGPSQHNDKKLAAENTVEPEDYKEPRVFSQ